MPFPQTFRTRACLFACLAALCGATWDFSAPDRWSLNAEAADADNAPHKNRLAEETSPYLLLHAHNPIDWYPWGPEALEKAKKEDKPIFLSVGYSSCYWCHVMERKVFSDETIAKYMNEHFVNIKVDREERPDVDDLYMTALSIYQQAAGVPQSGGWPLSMFLTPDARPLVGGTYFPPVAENGMIAFPDLAEKVHDIWTTRREQAESNADFLTHHLKRTMTRGLALQTVPLERTLVDGVVAAVAGEYDKQHGGFGFIPGNDLQPKFPTPSKLVLLQYEAARGNEDAAKMVANTLDHMADGGIWDHLGGGFHRYSVDRYWHVPHFEKMLYDNAQLADVYTQAFRQTGDPRYRRVTEEILAFVKRDMTSPEGAFYSAIDAETDAVEGKSYLWTEAQIAAVLSEADAKMFAMAYGLDNQPELEDHHVLRKTAEVRDVAQEFGVSVEEAQQRLDKARGELLAARQQRKAPLTDDKIMADWNGLMIRAYANAGAALNHPEYVQTAERAARFVLENMRDPQGGLLHTYRAGQAKFAAYVDDYAFLVDGLLALHAATGNHEWLDTARDLTDAQLKAFWDDDNGGCFFTAAGQEELLARGKQRFDNATPSGNSVTVRNLLRLTTLTGDPSYRQKAEQALTSMTPLLKQAPLGVTHLAVAAAEFLDAPQDVQSEKNGSEQGAAGGHGPVMRLVSALAAEEKKKDPEIVTGKAYLSVDRLPAGKTCEVIVVLKIDEAWHINANPPGDEFALPTEFTMKSKLKTKLGKVKYPKGKEMEVTGFDNPLFVYTKQAVLRSTLEVPAEAGGKKEEMELSIRYQACDDKRCLRPMTLKLKVPVAVAREGEEVKKINEKLFNPKKKNGEDEES